MADLMNLKKKELVERLERRREEDSLICRVDYSLAQAKKAASESITALSAADQKLERIRTIVEAAGVILCPGAQITTNYNQPYYDQPSAAPVGLTGEETVSAGVVAELLQHLLVVVDR